MSDSAASSLFHAIPLPDPVDDLTFAQCDEIETMTVRAKGLMMRDRYTFTDCFVIGYVRRGPFASAHPVRVLNAAKLEAKRREHFEAAYNSLKRELDSIAEARWWVRAFGRWWGCP